MAEDAIFIDGVRFMDKKDDTFEFKFQRSDLFAELTDDFSFKSQKGAAFAEPLVKIDAGADHGFDMGHMAEQFDDIM